uniref:SCAN box domain-containing protein n=1 Tax=Gasterosteus aculeatus TaxID=69293 RepID=G3NXL5_GASAC
MAEEGFPESVRLGFDVGANLRLMPRFNEKDPDTFFTLFERVADARNWPDADRTLMLQCVLTARAQEAYSALHASECMNYAKVKSAVLRDLLCHFNRWCSAASVESFDGLCDLIVLERFKNSIPPRIAVYVSEQKAATALRAAELADDFVLTHKSGFGEMCSTSDRG